jgi:hypothetical protein
LGCFKLTALPRSWPHREAQRSWPHKWMLVCSGKPKNLPATQSVQTESAAAEYVPATQLVQGDKFEQICRKPVVHFLKSPQAVGTS